MKSLEYFKFIRNIKNKKFKLIDDFLVNFRINKKEENNIKNIVVKLINQNEKKHKFTSYKDVYTFLNKTKFYKLNRNLDLMLELESIILFNLKKSKLVNQYIKGIEFPIGVRIVHPDTPNHLKNKLQTTTIHCDPWAGEPKDMINVVMYLSISNSTSRLNIFSTNKKDIQSHKNLTNSYKTRLFLHSKKYKEYLKNIINKPVYNLLHKNCEGYLFHGFVPHNTIRQGNNIRIGLEFRLRTVNPYLDTSRFLNKINRSGRFWFLPKKLNKNFDERLKDEIEELKKLKDFNYKINLRKKEIKKFYGY